MVPVQLAVLGDPPARVPVASDTFWIGRDAACDLCLWDLRVSRRHAMLRRVKGEYVLSAEGKHGVLVNGKRVTVMNLKHGDEISLTPPGSADPVRMRFENALEGVFVPPDVPISAVWLARDEARAPGGAVLGRYDLYEPLDGGMTGSVRRGRDRATGREVAVKTLGPVADGVAGDRFLRFAAAVSGAAHPSIVRVLEVGLSKTDHGGTRWIAMEIVPGRPASQRIAEGPQSAVTAIRRLRSLAGGLTLLHSRGVVHGGVEPSNVMLRPDGGATLVDLSHAYLVADRPPWPPKALGDLAYAPPETTPGAPADVFGLGALGYAMLTGKAPQRNETGTFQKVTAYGAAVPPPVEELLVQALAADPAKRPTAAGFLDAITAGAEPTGSRPAP